MNNAERIAELERKVDTMTKAMTVLQKWVDQVNDISSIDETLFDNLNNRVIKLEDHILCFFENGFECYTTKPVIVGGEKG